MKKLKKRFSGSKNQELHFNVLSQIKGGDGYPHDLFIGDNLDRYVPIDPPRR